MNFYTSIFKSSKIGNVMRYGEAGPGPMFTFSPAISFFVKCETQDEVDELWTKLSLGGATQQCGWLKDKFGVSWQIVPTVLGAMLQDKDPGKAKRVMEASPLTCRNPDSTGRARRRMR